jgi:hypothetical protein
MKKFTTAVFAAVIALALSMPAWSQGNTQAPATNKAAKQDTKDTKKDASKDSKDKKASKKKDKKKKDSKDSK